jgi:hypothetical protein
MKRTALVVAGAILLAGRASATVDNFCRVSISPNFSGGSGPYDFYLTQPGTINLSGSATGGFNSSGSATCHVEYGSVVINGVADVSLDAGGNGYIHDVLTITNPAVPSGTSGTLTYTIRVSGAFTAPSGSSASSYQFQSAFGGGSFDMTHAGRLFAPDLGGNWSGDPFGDYSATVPFTYGTPLQLTIQCTGSAQAANSGSGQGHATVSNLRFDWRGVGNVTANGSPAPGFSIASQSGTQYGGSLPPPCGTADFNCDGAVGTDADIESFFACLSGNCPPPPCTSTADFNGDGGVGTDADIEAFFRVLAGGAC